MFCFILFLAVQLLKFVNCCWSFSLYDDDDDDDDVDDGIWWAESEASPLPVYCTSTQGFTLAHQNVGYLTSDYTRSTDIGTKRCPWRIVAQVRALSLSIYLCLSIRSTASRTLSKWLNIPSSGSQYISIVNTYVTPSFRFSDIICHNGMSRTI